nr:MAG TPA: protein of unknown function (DUF4491) [Caudoviricetes sp.]
MPVLCCVCFSVCNILFFTCCLWSIFELREI